MDVSEERYDYDCEFLLGLLTQAVRKMKTQSGFMEQYVVRQGCVTVRLTPVIIDQHGPKPEHIVRLTMTVEDPARLRIGWPTSPPKDGEFVFFLRDLDLAHKSVSIVLNAMKPTPAHLRVSAEG